MRLNLLSEEKSVSVDDSLVESSCGSSHMLSHIFVSSISRLAYGPADATATV